MGEVTTRRRDAQILEGTFSGHVAAVDVEQMHRGLQALLDDGGAAFLVIDTVGVTDFSPQVRVPGVPFLSAMRTGGIQVLVAIAPNPMVRMMGSAIGLAASMRMVFVKDSADAEAALGRFR